MKQMDSSEAWAKQLAAASTVLSRTKDEVVRRVVEQQVEGAMAWAEVSGKAIHELEKVYQKDREIEGEIRRECESIIESYYN